MNQPERVGYFGNVNPDLLALIPLTARHVLELGCGMGAVARAFRERRMTIRWSGIELNSAAADVARHSIDAVLCADVELLSDSTLESFLGEAPDVLVLGDVLEHLRDPWEVLRRLVHKLAPGGSVIACIPNVAHWSMFDRMLRGNWFYEEQGLLDNTHLRFFTRESAQRMLESAGLSVVKVRPRELLLDEKRGASFIEHVVSSASALGVEPGALRQRMETLQYVFVAVKEPSATMLRLHQIVMVPDFMEVRTTIPWLALNSLPLVHATAYIKDSRLPPSTPKQPKILVLQRLLVMVSRAQWLDNIRKLYELGWVVVSEWDDHPDLLPESVHEKWRMNPWVPMNCVHACQTSTPVLAEVFRQHNPEVAVFENALLNLPHLPEKTTQRIKIVFAALNREGVNSWLIPAVSRVLERYPQVDVVIVQNRAFHDALKVAPERKKFIERLSYDNYLGLLAQAHIALLPLAGEEAERYKSDLKFIEATSRGVVCIASPLVYAQSIRHEETGWIARDPDEWEHYLGRAIADADTRTRMVRTAREEIASTRLIADQMARRVAWYRELWERREELHQLLLERFVV